MKIYEKIFAKLEELHMSQMELSRKTGIATSTISDWRKKQINPQADKLVSICEALDMSLVELLCDEENAESTAINNYVADENYMIELFRQSDTESRQRMISYLALLDVCRQINDSSQSQKQQRNVSVVQDIDGNNIVVINDIRFKGKRSIDWKEVRAYLKEYVGDFYKVASTFRKNQELKHKRDAKNGWYRYNAYFAIPVYGDNGEVERYNVFHASLLIRYANDGKRYLYDIIDIKKETSNSLGE